MDPVTHVLAAVTVAELLPRSVPEGWGLVTAAGASLAPDIDFVARRWGHTGLLRWHHTVTHSFVGTAALGALWAAVVAWATRTPWLALTPYAAIGVLTHVGLDYLLHNNGIMLGWPFTTAMPKGALFLGLNPQTSSARCGERKFTVCLLCQAHSLAFNRVFFLLGGTALGAAIFFPYRRYICAAGLLLLTAEIIRRAVSKGAARRLAAAALGGRPYIFPADFQGRKWLAAAPVAGGYQVARVDVREREVEAPRRLETAPDALITATRDRPSVRALLRNAILPAAELAAGGRELWWRDVSYAFSAEVPLHVLRLVLNERGEVEREEFRERW